MVLATWRLIYVVIKPIVINTIVINPIVIKQICTKPIVTKTIVGLNIAEFGTRTKLVFTDIKKQTTGH